MKMIKNPYIVFKQSKSFYFAKNIRMKTIKMNFLNSEPFDKARCFTLIYQYISYLKQRSLFLLKAIRHITMDFLQNDVSIFQEFSLVVLIEAIKIRLIFPPLLLSF